MNKLSIILVSLSLVLSSGCAKKSELSFSSESRSATGSATEPFQCAQPGTPGATDIQRLTKYELTNTVTDIFGTAVVSEVTSQLAAIPNDNSVALFETIERSVSSPLIQAYFDLAETLATRAVATDARISTLAGACFLAATLTNICLDGFIRQIGLKIFRKPLTLAEVSDLRLFYLANSPTRREGLQMLLADMLQSADFTYRLEASGKAVTADILELTPYELASRLSYIVTGSLPDTALFAAAANGALTTQEGLRSEFKRLIGTAKARAHIKYFYRQWFELTKPVSFGYSPEFLDGVTENGFLLSAERELEDFIDYVIWTKNGTMNDLLTFNGSFVQNSQLARIYNTAAWSAGSPPVMLSPQERSGILTRVRYLASGDDDTHPFRRGSRVLSGFLCYNPPRPNAENLPEDALVEPVWDPSLSTRHRFETKTLEPMCMSCHSKINPMAFALESFDGLGRHRTQEKIFDLETRRIISSVAVDSAVSYVFAGTGNRAINGPVQLSQELADSGEVDACFVRQWYRFSRGKIDEKEDHCSLSPMLASLRQEGGSILKVIETSVLDSSFRLRKLK